MLTPVSGSSSASVTSSDKYAVFKQLSVDQPAEPTPPASGTFYSSHNVCGMLGTLNKIVEPWQNRFTFISYIKDPLGKVGSSDV